MRKNKILKVFIAIALLISIETSAIAVSKGVVNVETVRVREKATTDSDIVELVSIGDKITITGEEGNWYKVKVGKVVGYIRKDLLTVDGKKVDVEPAEEPKENNNAEEPTQTEVPNEQTPSTGASGEEKPQEDGTQTEAPTTGNPVEEPSESFGDEADKNDRTISTIKVSSIPFVGEKIQLNQETKIKILPSANSSNIAKLQANTEVTVLEVINSWCRVETGENAGWVRIDQ